MKWPALLLALSLMQIRFYEASTRKLLRVAIYFWAILYWQLWISELISRVFSMIDLEWWSGVAVSFVGFLTGELCHIFFQREDQVIPKKGQVFPSFFTFSSIYLMLAWLVLTPPLLLGQAHIHIILISLLSVLLTIILSGISERLILSDVPRNWQGLPILLVSASILLMALYGFYSSCRSCF